MNGDNHMSDRKWTHRNESCVSWHRALVRDGEFNVGIKASDRTCEDTAGPVHYPLLILSWGQHKKAKLSPIFSLVLYLQLGSRYFLYFFWKSQLNIIMQCNKLLMVFTKYGHSSALSIKYGFSLRNFIFVINIKYRIIFCWRQHTKYFWTSPEPRPHNSVTFERKNSPSLWQHVENTIPEKKMISLIHYLINR